MFPSKTTPGAVNEADYEAYGYDAAGNRTSLRKRDGRTLTYQYDGLNRVSVKTVPSTASGTPGYSVHYRYDMRGLQTRARFGSASGTGITNAYDAFGRLVSSTTTMGGVSRTLDSEYDAGGRRLQPRPLGPPRECVVLESVDQLRLRRALAPVPSRS
ncbi:MAG: RHS repeat domain-containing protein [Pseudomonadales bacterium]